MKSYLTAAALVAAMGIATEANAQVTVQVERQSIQNQDIAWASSFSMSLNACQMQLYTQSLSQTRQANQAGTENTTRTAQDWQRSFDQSQTLFSSYGSRASNRQFYTAATVYTKALQAISFASQPRQAGSETAYTKAIMINGNVQECLYAYTLINSGVATEEQLAQCSQTIARCSQYIQGYNEDQQVSSLSRSALSVISQISTTGARNSNSR